MHKVNAGNNVNHVCAKTEKAHHPMLEEMFAVAGKWY